MGTRSVSAIVCNGEVVLSQTKQMDGYPSGLGVEIVKEIKIHWTKESLASAMPRVDQVDAYALCHSEGDGEENWRQKREALVAQPDYLDHIGLSLALVELRENPTSSYRMDINNIEFGQESLFCEWGYVVDLDRFVLEVFVGYNLDTPIDSGWFAGEGRTNFDGKHFHPIKKIAEFDLNQNLSELEDQLIKLEKLGD